MTKNNVDITVIDKETGEEVIGSKAVTNVWNIFFRIVAVFAASGLSIIGAGSLVGIDTLLLLLWQVRLVLLPLLKSLQEHSWTMAS
jgi:hypothetical protein